MITIITGVPGAGKTLYTVSEIAKEYEGREVFYYNIPQLALPWHELHDPERWMDCPDGSVVVVDEAHEVFPKRDYRSQEPEFIERLARHRHQGIDIVLITQFPKDLDIFIRRRCGRHIHLEKPLLRATAARVFQWPSYKDDFLRSDVQEKAEEFTFPYPKEGYGVYKSASVHIKQKRPTKKLTRAVVMVAVGVLIVVGAFWRLFGKLAGDDVELAQESGFVSPAAVGAPASLPDPWLSRHDPRVDGMPMTAPVYDGVREAKTYPRLQCIASVAKCRCYTQQASRVDVPESMCRDIVERGWFDYALEEKGGRNG